MSLNLRPFKTFIKEHCGLSCEDHCEEKLARALESRIADLALTPASYLARLSGDEDELQSLVNQLTVNETYFFREPEQIDLLVKRLAPRFLAARGGASPVRILSAGCSSGEEPYSLVMALTEKYGDSVARLFSFVGGDLDSAVLDKARAARYTDFSFRGVPEAMRKRYFAQDQRSHVLNEDIRKLVDFHELNLLATPFPPALHGFDIIFFRNVSIYFDTPTRKAIQHNLASLLKDDGVLVIGTAETLANDLGVLPLVEEDGLYYFVKGHPPLAHAEAFNPNNPLGRHTGEGRYPAMKTSPRSGQSCDVVPLPWGIFNHLDSGLRRNDVVFPNGHGKCAAPDDETCHARFPHLGSSLRSPLPQAGEEANESLREFHVNEQSGFNPPHSSETTVTSFPPLRQAQDRLLQRGESSAAISSAADAFAAPKTTKPSLDTARQLTRDRRYDEALPALDAVLSGEPDNIEAQLLKAHALINRKAFAAAEALAQRVLTADAWSIDALLLQGLAAKWQQRNADAIRHFKLAAYSRHECWLAHYYLADLYRDGGETGLAIRAYRVVIQLLSGNEPDTGIKYVPFGLPTAEIRFLCEHQLNKLSGAKTPAELR